MSTTTYLSDLASYNQSREYLEYPADKQRFLFYKHYIHEFRLLKFIETETSVYWVADNYKPRFTTKLFYTTKAETGITLDKKTKDIKIWFGKYPNEKLIDSFFAYNNVNPREVMSQMFRSYFTKSLATDIAKGKIKNIDDYALFLSKKSMFFRGVDPKQLSKLIYYDRMIPNSGLHLALVSDVCKVAKNIEETVDFIITGGLLENRQWILGDLARLALSLNEKINVYSAASMTSEQIRLNMLSLESSIKYRGVKEADDIPF